jgi:hypothetical protein
MDAIERIGTRDPLPRPFCSESIGSITDQSQQSIQSEGTENQQKSECKEESDGEDRHPYPPNQRIIACSVGGRFQMA